MTERAHEYREYYVTRKPSSFGERILRFWHGRMFRLAAARIPALREKSILEVGAGWGFFADVCRRNKVAYRGLEMNADQAQQLRSQGHDVTAAAIPPYPAGEPAQVVWMSHVLEHAETYRHAAGMLADTHARLEPGGYVVIIGPDINAWKGEFWGVDWSHGFPLTLRRVKQLLAETGFTVAAAAHHTATVAHPLLGFLLSGLFRLIPYNLLDAVLERVTGRPLAYSFMGTYGWRQILVIGQKRSAP